MHHIFWYFISTGAGKFPTWSLPTTLKSFLAVTILMPQSVLEEVVLWRGILPQCKNILNKERLKHLFNLRFYYPIEAQFVTGVYVVCAQFWSKMWSHVSSSCWCLSQVEPTENDPLDWMPVPWRLLPQLLPVSGLRSASKSERWRAVIFSFFFGHPVKYVIHVYAVRTRPNFPYTKYSGY